MNIYGDTGNVRALTYRLQQRNIASQVVMCEVGEPLPTDADIIVAGGGQDSGQLVVEKDIIKRRHILKGMASDGVVMLVICGTYQLFGHRFITAEQATIKGVGMFDMETKAGSQRLIGNIIVDSEFGELVGFENHSGKTQLAATQASLGRVVKGAGNNGHDHKEGATFLNVFGTYMHGPILPKNPQFADELLKRALSRKYGDVELTSINDLEEKAAAEIAKKRPR